MRYRTLLGLLFQAQFRLHYGSGTVNRIASGTSKNVLQNTECIVSQGLIFLKIFQARTQSSVERRRREDRGAECAEGGVPLPAGRGVWGGGCAPSPENFLIFELKKASFGASITGCYFLQLINLTWMETGFGHWVACTDCQWVTGEFWWRFGLIKTIGRAVVVRAIVPLPWIQMLCTGMLL